MDTTGLPAAVPSVLTPEQIELIKKRTVLINPDRYASVSSGSRIYYVRTDGRFTMGGVVKSVFLARASGKLMFRIAMESKKYGTSEYIIAAEKIKELYVETNAIVLQQIDALNRAAGIDPPRGDVNPFA